MNVSIAEAKGHLPKLVRAVEAGETVVITRHGKPVAQMISVPSPTGRVILGGLKDRTRLLPGWDDPITIDQFLTGDI